MDLIISITFAIIGILLVIGSTKKWKKLSSDTYIDDKIVSKRQYYRNVAIWGLLVFMTSVEFFQTEIEGATALDSLFIVGMCIGYSRMFFEPYFKASVAEDIDDLCLYLRPFQVDKPNLYKSKKGYVKGFLGIPEPIEKLLCNQINKKVSHTFAIGDPNTNIPSTFSTTNLYANNEEWKDTISSLAKKAKIIIIRVGDTKGCLWEMEHCANNALLGKTMFILDDSEKLSLIKKKIGNIVSIETVIDKKIKTCFALFLDEKCKKWVIRRLNSNSEIKKCIDVYMNKHKSLKKELECQRKNNGVFNLSSPKGKTPAKRWQVLSLLVNPIGYAMFNKWSKRWAFFCIMYFVLVFILTLVAYGTISTQKVDEDVVSEIFVFYTLIIWIFFLLPWLWLGPRISWRCRNWGSRYIFAKTNRSLALWLMAYTLCSILISIISEICQ